MLPKNGGCKRVNWQVTICAICRRHRQRARARTTTDVIIGDEGVASAETAMRSARAGKKAKLRARALARPDRVSQLALGRERRLIGTRPPTRAP